MAFIGVISDRKKFQNIEKILKSKNKKEYTLININRKSISNLKNIKFDIIIFLDLLGNFKFNSEDLHLICKDIKYLVINSDLDYKEQLLENVNANIITFGLNHLSTVTYSSVTDEKIWISIQRSFKDVQGNIIDVGEYCININKEFRAFLYEIMAIFICNQLM